MVNQNENIQRARNVGSNFTTFQYGGKAIAYLQSVQDSGQAPVAQPSPVHPLGHRHPVEIVTARAVDAGTLTLTITELWHQEVWEQMVGLAGTNDIVQVFERLARRDNYVTCVKIVNPPDGKRYGKVYHNCFSGDVRFLTKTGTHSLEEVAGTTQQVLGSKGHWTDASIESFGEQETYLVTLTRNGRRKTVRATAGHRWFKQGRRPQRSHAAEATTMDLVAGDALVSTYRVNQTHHIRPSAIGAQAGIVFGDGNIEGKAQNVSGVSLWGGKDAQLLKWFPHSPTRVVASAAGVAGIRVCDLPRSFKSAPDLGEGLTYLYGWLAGYFAADGTVSKTGTARLDSNTKSHLVLAQDVCHLLGIKTTEINEQQRTGFGGEFTGYSLILNVSDLTDEFFLIGEHGNRAAGRLSRTDPPTPSQWIVESVEASGEVEQVYCAVVPDGQSFTLEGNLLTGNCVISRITDGESITLPTTTVNKTVEVMYTHTTKL